MIVLDTNVVSELMRQVPHPGVVGWVAAQPRSSLCTTGINKAELLYGIALLAHGQRRSALTEAAKAILAEDLAGRILPFDGAAPEHFADLMARRRRAGRPLDLFDGLIAAIALAAGADIATRDTSGFEGCGLAVINPWTMA